MQVIEIIQAGKAIKQRIPVYLLVVLIVVRNCRDRVARVLRLAHPSFANGGGKLLGLRYP